jgi:copper chaperone NosL
MTGYPRGTTAGRLRYAAVLLLAACASATPRPIAYEQDVCGFCRMTVGDPRFGAELVTTKGRVHTFDSVECLASYYLANRANARSLWVTDAGRPGTLVPVEQARFHRAEPAAEGGSPMGLGLRAAADGTLRWADVLALVEREGLPAAGSRAAVQS